MTRPGQATAFEGLVDDYDASRPDYPAAVFDALPALADARVLELGAGTGKQTPGLLARGARLVSTDLGPKMLGRLAAHHPDLPVAVGRAEQLPFAADSFDGVCGAQMWHWVDVPAAAAEVARVLLPGGWLALWWNDVAAEDTRWWRDQQTRIEAGNPSYARAYRRRDFAGELTATGLFAAIETVRLRWERTLDWPLYERWLRSKSYVAQLADQEAFLAAERASLAAAFPDGRIVEPFEVQLHIARLPGT